MPREKPIIYLYDDPSAKTLRIEEIAKYLKDLFGNVKIVTRGEFLSLFARTNLDKVAERIARARVTDVMRNDVENDRCQWRYKLKKG